MKFTRVALAVAVMIGVVIFRQYTIPVIGWISFVCSATLWIAGVTAPHKPNKQRVYSDYFEPE